MPHVYGRISYRLQKSPAIYCPEVSAERGWCGISGAAEDLSPISFACQGLYGLERLFQEANRYCVTTWHMNLPLTSIRVNQ